MLFSPPNEFGRQPFFKIFGYSCAAHVMVLSGLFVMEIWLNSRPLIISLTKPGRVAFVGSQPGKSQGVVSAVTQTLPPSSMKQSDTSSQRLSHAVLPVKTQEEKAQKKPQKVLKPPVEKKLTQRASKIPEMPSTKPLKKALAGKKSSESTLEKKEAVPTDTTENVATEKKLSDAKANVVKDREKNLPIKKDESPSQSSQDTVQQKVKDIPLASKVQSSHSSTGHDESSQSYPAVGAHSLGTGAGEEVNVSDAVYSEDSIQKEFGTHFTIPEGFEEYDSFTISFDIVDGKVVHVSPHKQGALVVYTAVKDALLKSTMPVRSRKNVVWIIT